MRGASRAPLDVAHPALRRWAGTRCSQAVFRFPRRPEVPKEWNRQDDVHQHGIHDRPLVEIHPPYEDQVIDAVAPDEEHRPADSVVGVDTLLVISPSRPPPQSRKMEVEDCEHRRNDQLEPEL